MWRGHGGDIREVDTRWAKPLKKKEKEQERERDIHRESFS
jgi:hypothetical protein